MMSMICRVRRVPLLPTNLSSATATATAAHHALNLSSRSILCRAAAAFLGVNAQQQSSYSTVNTIITIGSNGGYPRQQIQPHDMHQGQQRRDLVSRQMSTNKRGPGVKLSTLLCKHMGLSRRQSERMILTERVTLFGATVTSPTFELHPSNDPKQHSTTAMKVDGKLIQDVEKTLKLLYKEQQEKINAEDDSTTSSDTNGKAGKRNIDKIREYSNTRVWLANKLKGELITEDDPVGRPSMLQRLTRGGVGKTNKKNSTPVHLKAVGRLDMMTEGLMIFTNDGKYARQLELPTSQLWRTYRIRVHGRLTMGKLRAMRKGLTVRVNDNLMAGDKPSGEVVKMGRLMKYKGIKVSIERKNISGSRKRGRGSTGGGGTNTWLRVTCTEGKNRQLRRIMSAMGLDATRLIRVSYGDYELNTIPPGMAVEVPCKWLDGMKKKGPLFVGDTSKKSEREESKEKGSTVQWVNYA